MLPAETMYGISRALHVPVEEVVVACARTLGIEMRRPSSLLLMMMPSGTEDLPDEVTQALVTLIRYLVDAAQGEAGEGQPAAPTLRAARRGTGNEARGPAVRG